MRDLSNTEIEVVAGGWSHSISDSLEGAILGGGEGLALGIGLGGGPMSKTDSLLSPLAQAVGAVVGGVIGIAWGGLGGLVFGKDEIASKLDSYKENFGRG